MRVLITVGELIDRDLWVRAAELLGFNPYAVSEGQIDHGDEITIPSTQAFQLGLIRMADNYEVRPSKWEQVRETGWTEEL